MKNESTKALPLVGSYYIERIRDPKAGGLGRRSPVEYGDIERVIATGRARCRSCGNKIIKGSPEIRFYWDFRGCGSWTAVECHIHQEDCGKA